jgi:hypothetical protein
MPKVLVQVALNLIVLYLNTKDPGREWYKLQSDVQKYHTREYRQDTDWSVQAIPHE